MISLSEGSKGNIWIQHITKESGTIHYANYFLVYAAMPKDNSTMPKDNSGI